MTDEQIWERASIGERVDILRRWIKDVDCSVVAQGNRIEAIEEHPALSIPPLEPVLTAREAVEAMAERKLCADIDSCTTDRIERWKRIERAAMRVAGSSASNHVVTPTRNGVEVMAELIQALQS